MTKKNQTLYLSNHYFARSPLCCKKKKKETRNQSLLIVFPSHFFVFVFHWPNPLTNKQILSFAAEGCWRILTFGRRHLTTNWSSTSSLSITAMSHAEFASTKSFRSPVRSNILLEACSTPARTLVLLSDLTGPLPIEEARRSISSFRYKPRYCSDRMFPSTSFMHVFNAPLLSSSASKMSFHFPRNCWRKIRFTE